VDVLPKLDHQLQVLTSAEEDTRVAMAQWATLICSSRAAHAARAPFSTAAALEQGLALAGQQIAELTDPLGLELLEGTREVESEDEEGATIDGLAEVARLREPGLFQPLHAPGKLPDIAPPDVLHRRLEVIADVSNPFGVFCLVVWQPSQRGKLEDGISRHPSPFFYFAFLLSCRFCTANTSCATSPSSGSTTA
jgi:hypothetical protein